MTIRARRALFPSLLLATLSHLSVGQGTTQPNEKAQNHVVQVAMKNVMYHFTDQVAVHVVQLQGTLTPTGGLIVFDDRSSFTLNLASAEIAMTCNSLARVLNDDVFSSATAPVKDVTIESKNNQLLIKGKLHQKGDVPFETTGTLSVEGDGRIRLHTEHLKAAHLPVKGLLDLLGMDISRMINTKKIQGVSADKDDLILNPEEVLPPPHIKGRVSAVRIQGNELVQVYGSLQVSNFASKQHGNYMAYHDGTLRFGKLTMEDADLILIDMDASDSFDFYLDHYKEQLVAGYTKITPEFGLRVYARDYNKLPKRSASHSSK
jgi:hypothetical protein